MIRITGTGHYLPPLTVSNDDLSQIVETDDEWIVSRTGIHVRHIAVEDTTSSMAIAAARRALESAGVEPDEVGLVICATVTPDMTTPMVAAYVKAALGIGHAATFDLNANCSSCVYALTVAHSLMTTGGYAHALVIGSDANSQQIDWSDRATCVLFGDGAGAFVLSEDDSGDSGILATYLDCIIDEKESLVRRTQRDAHPWSDTVLTGPDTKVKMVGADIMKFSNMAFGTSMGRVCEQAGVAPDDIDCVIAHQANLRILSYAARKSGIPLEKFFVSIDHTANTSSASVPIALDEAILDRRIEQGDLVLVVAFGGGLTMGAVLIRW